MPTIAARRPALASLALALVLPALTLVACDRDERGQLVRSADSVSPAAVDTGAGLTASLERALWSQSPPAHVAERHWPLIRRLYEEGRYEPRWVDASGLTAQGRELLDVLCRAGVEGVALGAADGTSADDPVAREIALSAAWLRYLETLASGGREPAAAGARWRVPAPQPPADSALAAALRLPPAAAAAAFRPASPAYARLRALADSLAGRRDSLAAAAAAVIPLDSAALRPGRRDSSVLRLRRLLVARGDLPPADTAGLVVTTAVTRAVRRFQQRHDLPPTGLLDADTRALLALSRTEQLGLVAADLERYRWLPRAAAGRRLVLDLGAGQLELRSGDGRVLTAALRASAACRAALAPLVADTVAEAVADSAGVLLRLAGGDSLRLSATAGTRAGRPGADPCLGVAELGPIAGALTDTLPAGTGALLLYFVSPAVVVRADSSVVFRPRAAGVARPDSAAVPPPICAEPSAATPASARS